MYVHPFLTHVSFTYFCRGANFDMTFLHFYFFTFSDNYILNFKGFHHTWKVTKFDSFLGFGITSIIKLYSILGRAREKRGCGRIQFTKLKHWKLRGSSAAAVKLTRHSSPRALKGMPAKRGGGQRSNPRPVR